MERVRDSFNRQGFPRTLGAVLESVEAGTVTITCGFSDGLTQQHGLLHGGVVATLAVGHVIQSGRTLTVCEGSVFDATRTRLLARMTATMMAVDAG